MGPDCDFLKSVKGLQRRRAYFSAKLSHAVPPAAQKKLRLRSGGHCTLKGTCVEAI